MTSNEPMGIERELPIKAEPTQAEGPSVESVLPSELTFPNNPNDLSLPPKNPKERELADLL